jgi:quinol monooxygenase YgiN
MITIVAKMTLKPGKKEDFIALTEELRRESRKEKGCISYELYEDIKDPNALAFIEEWRDEEAIKFHNESKHYTGTIPKLLDLREGKAEIYLYKLIEDKL